MPSLRMLHCPSLPPRQCAACSVVQRCGASGNPQLELSAALAQGLASQLHRARYMKSYRLDIAPACITNKTMRISISYASLKLRRSQRHKLTTRGCRMSWRANEACAMPLPTPLHSAALATESSTAPPCCCGTIQNAIVGQREAAKRRLRPLQLLLPGPRCAAGRAVPPC